MKRSVLFFLIVLIISCKQTNQGNEEINLGLDYYPVKIGSTWIYTVDSIAYDNNTGVTTIDTFRYEYKEVISSNFSDVSGNTGQLLNRFYRKNDSSDWFQANNWTVLITKEKAERVEENIRFVKIAFPVAVNKRWNGNMYNAREVEQYRIINTNRGATYGNTFYHNTMLVQQAKELNAIEEIAKQEVYAQNVGLVYKLSDSINTQVSGSRGFRYRITLKSFTP